MIKLIDILSEAKIVPQGALDFSNTKHPAVYNFVVANKERILQTIKDDYKRHNYTNDEDTFEGTSGITDISDTIVSNENYWKYIDEENEFPNGQEIEIIGNNQQERCTGIIITNIDPNVYNKLASGLSWNEMPNPYNKLGLYYAYMSC